MKKILKSPMAVLFGAFVLVVFLVDVLNADRYSSELENTILAQKPVFMERFF